MTYKQRSEMAALLAPARLFSVTEARADPRLIPDAPGAYAWWFDRRLNAAPDEPIWQEGAWMLHYVGIAPRRRAADGGFTGSTLRERLKRHYAGSCACSTLRRSLAALLGDELQLRPALTLTGKLKLLGDGEDDITLWLETHARLCWVAHDAPRVLEQTILRASPPSLNIAGVESASARRLRRRRRACAALAAAAASASARSI